MLAAIQSPLTRTSPALCSRRTAARCTSKTQFAATFAVAAVDTEGRPLENWETLCRRVSNAVALVDEGQPDYEGLADRFFTMIYYLDFLPNSPCLMNAGTELGQLAACFVLPVGDSMDEIFDADRKSVV